MRGLCFRSPESVAVDSIADPVIESPTDVIVQVSMAGLCGSDLHAYFGRESGLDSGTVMGHEFVGTVLQAGASVRHFRPGDHVCAPFTTNCGVCFFCQRGLTSRCPSGQLFGWRQQGDGLHGGQAERVRVPLADHTLVAIPTGIDQETALLIGDNLSTAHFAIDLAEPDSDDIVVVIGCGTVGLLAIDTMIRIGSSTVVAIDPNPDRLNVAKTLGAETFSDPRHAIDWVRQMSESRGADRVLELVGLPDAQATAIEIVRPGGVLATIGCHCSPHFAFSPSDAYDKNLTYRTGRCPARAYMPRLLSELVESPVDYSWAVTHRFGLEDAVEAYGIFSRGRDRCIKAVLDIH